MTHATQSQRRSPPQLRLIKPAKAQRTSCAPGLCESLHTCADRHCHGHPLHASNSLGSCGEVCGTSGCTQAAGCMAHKPSSTPPKAHTLDDGEPMSPAERMKLLLAICIPVAFCTLTIALALGWFAWG